MLQGELHGQKSAVTGWMLGCVPLLQIFFSFFTTQLVSYTEPAALSQRARTQVTPSIFLLRVTMFVIVGYEVWCKEYADTWYLAGWNISGSIWSVRIYPI